MKSDLAEKAKAIHDKYERGKEERITEKEPSHYLPRYPLWRRIWKNPAYDTARDIVEQVNNNLAPGLRSKHANKGSLEKFYLYEKELRDMEQKVQKESTQQLERTADGTLQKKHLWFAMGIFQTHCDHFQKWIKYSATLRDSVLEPEYTDELQSCSIRFKLKKMNQVQNFELLKTKSNVEKEPPSAPT
jgi:hypothetical protein